VSASRKVLPLNNFCNKLYLSFSSSAVAADFDCHQETLTRDISDSVSHLLCSVACIARRFKSTTKRKRPAECLDYESTERAITSGSARVEYSAQSKDPFIRARETGHFYPTTARNVPGISFKAEAAVTVCLKDYPVPKHKSAGFIMNGCPCPLSFGLGASTTMQSGESLSMVWTIILHFFPFVVTVVYDNACHLFVSIHIRLPLSLLGKSIVADRFHHIKGHSCGCSFGADVLPDLDKSCTSNVECLNKLLRRIATSVLHVRPQNFSTYVALRVVFVNMLTRWSLKANKVNSDGASLSGILNSTVKYKCWRCVEARGLPFRVFLRLEGEVRSQLYVGALSASVAAVAKAVCQERKRAGLRGVVVRWQRGTRQPV
jgi:hypothetical protein